MPSSQFPNVHMRPARHQSRYPSSHANAPVSPFAEYSTSLVLILLAAGCFVFLLWTFDRGLDLTDEGYYLLSARFPNDIVARASLAYLYTSSLFSLVGYSIPFHRVSGLVLLLVATLPLCMAVNRFSRDMRPEVQYPKSTKLATTSFLWIGAMTYYSCFLPTPSYNLLNAVAAIGSTGLIFMALTALDCENQIGPEARYAFFGAGLLIAVSFFCKFPTAICLFAAFSGTVLAWPGHNIRTRGRILGTMALGMITWFGVHFALVQSPGSFWKIFRQGIEFSRQMNEKLHYIEFYSSQLKTTALWILKEFWQLYLVVGVGWIGLIVARKAYKEFRWAPEILSGLSIAMATWLSYQHGHYLDGALSVYNSIGFYMAWGALLFINLFAALAYYRKASHFVTTIGVRRIAILLLLLLSAPFFGAVGTNTGIVVGARHFMAVWFALAILMLEALSKAGVSRLINPLFLVILGTIACSRIVSGIMYDPYRLNAPISHQTQPTSIGWPSSNLKLDKSTSRSINEIRSILSKNGFQPGNDVLGFWDMPGIVFSVGGRSPGKPWYTSGYARTEEIMKKIFNSVPKDRLKKAFILKGPNRKGRRNPELKQLGLPFPDNYTLCGTVSIPRSYSPGGSIEIVQIWKPIPIKN